MLILHLFPLNRISAVAQKDCLSLLQKHKLASGILMTAEHWSSVTSVSLALKSVILLSNSFSFLQQIKLIFISEQTISLS